MLQVLTFPEELIQETGKSPAACVVLPFEPQIKERSSIESKLKTMVEKAGRRLLQQYSYRKALPVIARLQQLIGQVSYYNYKKSLALLATPYLSKLFYLDFPVTETVRTGEDLDIRNIVKAKSNQPHYLLLVLNKTGADIYEGGPADLNLVKHNTWPEHDCFKQADLGLDLLLEAFHLPVFVIGSTGNLDAYKKQTVHADQIMAYVPYNDVYMDKTVLLAALQPELDLWTKRQQQFVLQKLDKARKTESLHTGMEKVWYAANHRRSVLLAIEDNYMHIIPFTKKLIQLEEPLAWPVIDPLQHTDQVNETIEKVLKHGGDVVFLPPGSLSSFEHIALVEGPRPVIIEPDASY